MINNNNHYHKLQTKAFMNPMEVSEKSLEFPKKFHISTRYLLLMMILEVTITTYE